jgi:hypothetical protein
VDKKYGNLNEARTAKQRARNTCLRDVSGVGTDGGDDVSAGVLPMEITFMDMEDKY